MGRLLICAALVAGVAGDATAQVNNEAAAEALFLEGRSLMKQKSFAEAADKFAASDKASPSVGARLSLGDCYLAVGKTASAWTSYKAAANLARQKQDSDRAKIANKKAGEVAVRLTYLIVKVPEPVPGLEVEVAGKPVSAALFGQKIPVDPGELAVVATAEGFEPFSTKATAAGAGQVVAVTVPSLGAVATVPDDKPDRPDEPDEPDRPDRPDDRPDVKPDTPDPAVDTGVEDPGRTRRYIGLGVGAAGLVGVGVGLAVGAAARSKWNGAFDDGLCDEATNVCSAEGQSQTDDARSLATISTIAVIGGVALIGAGALLYLTAPEASDGRSARLAPVIGDGQLGLALGGSF